MEKRISIVRNVRIQAIGLSSIFLVGDSMYFTPKTDVFALQRQIPFFWGNEGNFRDYSIFSRIIPKPIITEQLQYNRVNRSPYIRVNNIHLLGISSSSLVQIGSNHFIDAESRVKHIRHLIDNSS